MKENELDILLEQYCRQEITPPPQLTKAVKLRLKTDPLPVALLPVSLFFNALVMLLSLVVFFDPALSIMQKFALYFAGSILFNSLMVLVLLKPERLNAFFRQLTLGMTENANLHGLTK
ncbi:MAG: hypothetical protein GY765_35155 [bacterium]|nr:hypothetical protein [bacterium]